MKPFPEHALVPYMGQVVPIFSRSHSPEHGWTYCLRLVKGHLLDVHPDVPHAVIIASIGAVARWAVDEWLIIQDHRVQVSERKWSFQLGTVVYTVGDPRIKNKGRTFTQERLLQLIHPEEDTVRLIDQATTNAELRSIESRNTFNDPSPYQRRKRG